MWKTLCWPVWDRSRVPSLKQSHCAGAFWEECSLWHFHVLVSVSFFCGVVLGSQESGVEVLLTHLFRSVAHCWNTVPDTHNLEEERFLLTQGCSPHLAESNPGIDRQRGTAVQSLLKWQRPGSRQQGEATGWETHVPRFCPQWPATSDHASLPNGALSPELTGG